MDDSALSDLSQRLNSELNEVVMLVIFLLLALVILLFAGGLPPRARQVPMFIAIVAVLLISIRLLRLISGEGEDSTPVSEETGSEGTKEEGEVTIDEFTVESTEETDYNFRTIVHISAIVGLFIFLIYLFGYIIASFLFIISMGRYFGSISLAKSVALAVGVTVTVYLVFIRLLDIPLPQGIFF